VFEMASTGLVAVANPSAAFLAERPLGVPGSVVAAVLEGQRALLVEVQALASKSPYASPRRVVQGSTRAASTSCWPSWSGASACRSRASTCSSTSPAACASPIPAPTWRSPSRSSRRSPTARSPTATRSWARSAWRASCGRWRSSIGARARRNAPSTRTSSRRRARARSGAGPHRRHHGARGARRPVGHGMSGRPSAARPATPAPGGRRSQRHHPRPAGGGGRRARPRLGQLVARPRLADRAEHAALHERVGLLIGYLVSGRLAERWGRGSTAGCSASATCRPTSCWRAAPARRWRC
jgi:hypothetical protein